MKCLKTYSVQAPKSEVVTVGPAEAVASISGEIEVDISLVYNLEL